MPPPRFAGSLRPDFWLLHSAAMPLAGPLRRAPAAATVGEAAEQLDERKLALRETPYLISSEKVDGTATYNREGEKLGAIWSLHGRETRRPSVLRRDDFGGQLGMRVDHYPLP